MGWLGRRGEGELRVVGRRGEGMLVVRYVGRGGWWLGRSGVEVGKGRFFFNLYRIRIGIFIG